MDMCVRIAQIAAGILRELQRRVDARTADAECLGYIGPLHRLASRAVGLIEHPSRCGARSSRERLPPGVGDRQPQHASVRPAAFMISGFATRVLAGFISVAGFGLWSGRFLASIPRLHLNAKQHEAVLASSLTVNPCARNISSVHPFGLPARISSARRCSALRSRLRGLTAG
jgi:hypothetical protein